eukprot:6479122-Heterocapsa_arctica.AAC.1
MVLGAQPFSGPLSCNHSLCGGNETGAGGRFRSALFSPGLGTGLGNQQVYRATLPRLRLLIGIPG